LVCREKPAFEFGSSCIRILLALLNPDPFIVKVLHPDPYIECTDPQRRYPLTLKLAENGKENLSSKNYIFTKVERLILKRFEKFKPDPNVSGSCSTP